MAATYRERRLADRHQARSDAAAVDQGGQLDYMRAADAVAGRRPSPAAVHRRVLLTEVDRLCQRLAVAEQTVATLRWGDQPADRVERGAPDGGGVVIVPSRVDVLCGGRPTLRVPCPICARVVGPYYERSAARAAMALHVRWQHTVPSADVDLDGRPRSRLPA